jgi:NAD(P)-dependent dehydrogenase (short-subunit alcohol dehydrogenase family)
LPVALITGGAIRLGRAISIKLSKTHRIAIHCNKSVENAHKVAREIKNSGGICSVHPMDLTRPMSAKHLINQIEQKFGRLDVLVNNAALFLSDSAPVPELAKMKILNFDIPKALTDLSTTLLSKHEGAIINIGDIAGFLPISNYAAYSKTKEALINHTKNTALKLAENGVKINIICPGTIGFSQKTTENQKQKIKAAIPLKKTGNFEDIANLVYYLATSPFITGQTITVDGGRLLKEFP